METASLVSDALGGVGAICQTEYELNPTDEGKACETLIRIASAQLEYLRRHLKDLVLTS